MHHQVFVLLVVVLWAAGPAFAAGKQREPKSPPQLSADAAYAGRISWTQHSANLDSMGRGQPFNTRVLLRDYADRARSREGRDGRYFFGADGKQMKFVLFRQRPAREMIEWQENLPKNPPSDLRRLDHVLAVVTPNGRQPLWLHDADPAKSHHLGRMILATLRALPGAHPDIELPARAFINTPGSASMPRLHVHGMWDTKRPIKDWPGFLRRNGYRRLELSANGYAVYQAPEDVRSKYARRWPIIALADAKRVPNLERPSLQTQTLVGDMALAIKDVLLGQSHQLRDLLQRGKIELSQADHRLVLRATTRRPGERN